MNVVFGSEDLYWLTFYKFINDVLSVKKTDVPLNEMFDLYKSVGWFWPYKGFIVISSKPTSIKMKEGRLHSCDGPAVEYADGFKLYSMNGVAFRGDVIRFVETPKDKLVAKEVLSIKNAEQRAETIKKFGIDRLFWELNPTKLDAKDDYELYRVPVYEDMPRVYLKMKNPSVDEVHIEAVPPDTRTVDQALAFRNFGSIEIPFVPPLQLT